MALPQPEDVDQRRLIQTTFDLFSESGEWPTFAAVDAVLDQTYQLDALALMQSLPPHLLYPPVRNGIEPTGTLSLTVAGLAACNGADDILSLFIGAVRAAADLERRPRAVVAESAVFGVADVRALRPEAGAAYLLKQVGLALAVDNWGWSVGSASGSNWSFTLDRRVRRYRDLVDVEDYWRRRAEARGPSAPLTAPSSSRVQVARDVRGAWDAEVVPAESVNNKVFVVYGRNSAAKTAMFDFLRRIGLSPIEWEHARRSTGKASPYIGEILREAFTMAQAVVVLMTPDEVAHLRSEYADRPEETVAGPQARPNVIFEAGMALGLHEDRTVIVEMGSLREISDYAGRHSVRNITSSAGLKAVADRLETAGCPVDLSGSDWMNPSQFQEPPAPGDDLPWGRQAAPRTSSRPPVDVQWHSGNRGSGTFEVINYSGRTLHDVYIDPPVERDEHRGAVTISVAQPVKKLPAGKSASVSAITLGFMNNVMVTVRAITDDGASLTEEVFVNLRS